MGGEGEWKCTCVQHEGEVVWIGLHDAVACHLGQCTPAVRHLRRNAGDSPRRHLIITSERKANSRRECESPSWSIHL